MSGRDGEAVLDGVFSAQLARAMKGLQEAGAKYVFLPSERTPGKDPLALSMIATFLSSPDGPLDGWIGAKVREGAEILDSTGRIIHWRERRAGLDDETRRAQSIYVMPVPGTGRRHTLMLTAPPSSVRNPGTTSTLWPCERSSMPWHPPSRGYPRRSLRSEACRTTLRR